MGKIHYATNGIHKEMTQCGLYTVEYKRVSRDIGEVTCKRCLLSAKSDYRKYADDNDIMRAEAKKIRKRGWFMSWLRGE